MDVIKTFIERKGLTIYEKIGLFGIGIALIIAVYYALFTTQQMYAVLILAAIGGMLLARNRFNNATKISASNIKDSIDAVEGVSEGNTNVITNKSKAITRRE